jgi:uncharacterized protein YdeI (YjbR/CyaY-like superfamily)
MNKKAEYPVILFSSQQDWETWLHEHHSDARGVWLKIAKKGVEVSSVTYAEALETALCYGWIDGQKASFDQYYWLQKLTPRAAKSIWSKVNCDKVTTLLAANKMQPAGIKQVELAKADGRWDAAYESQSKMTVPEDLQLALEKNQRANEFFQTLNSANRYAILFRVHNAKRPETRAARIQKFVEMLANQQKIHP